MNKIQQFIDTIENKNSAKVAKHVLKRIPDSIENYTLQELNELILSLNPKSQKEIITTIYELNTYAKWLYKQKIVKDDILQKNIEKIDKKALWNLSKSKAPKKFISYEQLKNTIQDISIYEEYNALYYELLFKCIYEGIYSEDLSVIKNLKSSDILENVITLHEDNGHIYKLKVSNELASQLKQLANINIWERKNRYGTCKVNMKGVYNDSIFKIEDRKTSSNEGSYRFSYYSRLRKISNEYLESPLLPFHLFVSGIMHRIKGVLNKNDISLEEAFAENSRNKLAHTIISKELARCNSGIDIGNFRELVKGHIEIFTNDTTDDIDNDIFLEIYDEQQEFLEGKEILDIHISHERDEKIVALAKEKFKLNHSGKLFCEQCGFNFAEKYGERGEDFIEVHHTKFIANRKENEVTNVEDLVMLCSNCHSIVHRKLPWLNMTELKNILKKNEK